METEEPREGRTAHAATQTFGLLLLVATVVGVLVVGIIAFDGEDVGAFAVAGLVVAGAAFATWRFDRQWARWTGVAASVISLGGFFFAFGLFQIFSPVEFGLGITYVLGVVLSLVGGIRALRAGRRGAIEAVGAHGRVQRRIVTVVGALVVVSVVGLFVTRETVSEADAAGAVVIDMVKFEFEPQAVTVPAGGKLLVRNSDPFVHDFTLDDLGIEVTVGPGSETIVDVNELAPGSYDYFCSLHSDGSTGMMGSFVVSG